tara:strand:+ start:1972 stop:4668 length:2697 start_codon:yes stop_codon:yes gene_type:complete
MSNINNLKAEYELDNSRTIVDPRSLYTRIWDSLEHPNISVVWAIISIVLSVIWPVLLMPCTLVFFILRAAVVGNPDVLPIHLPMDAQKEDKNNPKPGENNGYEKGAGAFYVGRIMGLGWEVWLSFKALTQHFLIFGTTGSGKTESIVSYIVNYLSVGSGVAFQDAKAAPKAMIQMATICRIFGRDDDFRVTNYITPINSKKTDPAARTSNDSAVFARGAAETNTQLLVSLLPPSDGENKLFSERAVALISALQPALVDLRDQGRLQIDPSVIRENMAFAAFVQLYRNNNISMRSRLAMLAYLKSLPGFDEKQPIAKQPEEVTRQFGFAQAYFTRSLASLSDTYGHIYLTSLGEIDYQDAVLNGRVLMTLLPSLQKSGDELDNLGKIVLTALKNGMVVGLGTHYEGSAEKMVYNLPTNSEIPYGVMNDENAYMLIEGQEMMNAQARGLGFGIMTGTQDVAGMIEKISRTTKQIMANSAIKQIGYLDDKDTTELACEFSGEAQVITRGRYELKGDFNNMYADQSMSVERRKRIESTDVKKLDIGQAFMLYKGKVHLTQLFNHGISDKADAKPLYRYVQNWYSVRMPKIITPNTETMMRLIELEPDITEWQELATLVSDDTRVMTHEMTSYFRSILKISHINEAYRKNPELLEIIRGQSSFHDTSVFDTKIEASNELLGDEHSLVGVLGKVLGRPIPSYKSVPALLAAVSKDKSIAEVRLSHEAAEANLSLANLDELDDMDFVDRDETGSGGGAGNSPHSAGNDILLDHYLSGADGETPIEPPAPIQKIDEENPVGETQTAATTSKEAIQPSTKLGMAVERNLHLMPWMANAIDYGEAAVEIVEVETYFAGGDREQAESNVELALDMLGGKIIYPETKINKGTLDIKTARDLLGPMLGQRD